MNKQAPLPLFDSIENLEDQVENIKEVDVPYPRDYQHTLSFLTSYNGNKATFNAYRREVERLIHWSWHLQKKSIFDLRRADIEVYLAFCQQPPVEWIGIKKAPRFIVKDAKRVPNPEWRPFVVTLSKAHHRLGRKPDPILYELSQNALKEIFAILSSFYNFLIQEEATDVNPIAHIRQKSKYLRKQQSKAKIRRLSDLQWHYVIETAEIMAAENPIQHERTLFIMTALYAMYLRISELVASERWLPQMCDFHRDNDGLWWFTTVGKGNKERQIAVSQEMLAALKRYRLHLGLTPLPTIADISPLLPKINGKGPISSTTYVREIVQNCFDCTMERLKNDGFHEDADALLAATVHWLRHTGISEDVKHRPREHVRDDAGHSSGAITDRYIDIELRERHRSAKNKHIKPDGNNA